MGTLLLFFDGIGVGSGDPERNPFARPGFARLGVLGGGSPDGAAFRPLDATLGVPGLPQSATGQTTLYTGVNAAALLGRHQVGVPGPSLWPLLERESLFAALVARGGRPTFANAFTRAHLEARRPRFGATTRMARASGVRLRMLEEDEGRDRALPHDYTGEWLRRRGVPCRERDADAAAAVLLDLLGDHDLVLYEYFLTDLAGHRGTAEEREIHARRADALVDAVVSAADLGRDRVVVVSDHGNLEEADHDRHTLNPVPLLAWGRGAEALVASVDRLEEFKKGVRS